MSTFVLACSLEGGASIGIFVLRCSWPEQPLVVCKVRGLASTKAGNHRGGLCTAAVVGQPEISPKDRLDAWQLRRLLARAKAQLPKRWAITWSLQGRLRPSVCRTVSEHQHANSIRSSWPSEQSWARIRGLGAVICRTSKEGKEQGLAYAGRVAENMHQLLNGGSCVKTSVFFRPGGQVRSFELHCSVLGGRRKLQVIKKWVSSRTFVQRTGAWPCIIRFTGGQAIQKWRGLGSYCWVREGFCHKKWGEGGMHPVQGLKCSFFRGLCCRGQK